jgi:hypothetical protein
MSKTEYFVLTYIGSSVGESGEPVGSVFDLTKACTNCGTGARVVGNLNVKNIETTKHLFTTLDGDSVISQALKDCLEQSNILMGGLYPIVDSKYKELPFYHLNPPLYFPKSDPDSKGLKIENQCHICHRDGYFNDVVIGNLVKGIKTEVKPLQLVYTSIEEGLLKGSDVFYSWEHMGTSNIKPVGVKVLRYARPLLVISKLMKDLLIEFKVKNVIFEQIIFH